MRVYQVVELANGRFLGVYKSRYYLTKFFATRRALKLQMQFPDHVFKVESR